MTRRDAPSELPMGPTILGTLTGLSDEHGVVSVYLDTGLGSGSREPRAPGLTAALHALETISTPRPPPEWHARIDGIARRVEELASVEHGVPTLCLYTTVGGGRETLLRAPRRIETAALHGQRAWLRPLLLTAEEAQPTGLVVVGSGDLVVYEVAFGHVNALERDSLAEDRSAWRSAAGSRGPSPGRGTHAEAEHDHYARRVGARHARIAPRVAERLRIIGGERGWATLVVAGDPRHVGPLVEHLEDAPFEAVRSTSVAPPEAGGVSIADLAARDARAARTRRRRRLVEGVSGGARARHGHGVVGLDDTLTVLREGRVHVLVIDPGRTAVGFVAPDGRALRDRESLPGVRSGRIAFVSDLYDWCVHQALRTDAAVVPVEGPEADPLGEDGIGALLRW